MIVKYLGPDIGIDGLFDQKEYAVIEIDPFSGMLRILDESGEDYLYHPTRPKAFAGEYKGGKFEMIQDDSNQSLQKAMSI